MKRSHLLYPIIFICFGFQQAMAIPKISRYELWWAIGHPFAALKVKHIYKKLRPFYNEAELKSQLDNYSSGGKLDAFRHTFYMAAFAQKIKPKKVLKLGRAHEKTNYLQFKKNKNEFDELPDSISGVMDLLNNEIGVKMGIENRKASLAELKQKILILLKHENVYYMLRDQQGRFLDCNNHVIDLTLYKGKWFIPKCLLGYKAKQESD